jgi:hypothetical protein
MTVSENCAMLMSGPCIQNFAYRSICEHIRRAHPDNWIPKLPASPETFAKMVGLMPRNNMENGMVSHVSIAPSPRKHANITRKPAKRKFKISAFRLLHYGYL